MTVQLARIAEYPAYREPGDRPREYLIGAATAAIAPPRPGCTPPTWPLIEAPELVEDVCSDYLRAVDHLRIAELDLSAELDKHHDTTELLAAALRESVRLQAQLTQRDAEIADLRRRPSRRDDGDPMRPPRRRVRWSALDDEIDTRVVDVPIIGVAL